MEITGKNNSVNLDTYVKNVKDKRKIDVSTKQASKDVFEEDKVVLSPKAREIREAKKVLSSVPDVREDEVARIKKEIEDGTYRIEGKKLATKMIRESLLKDQE
ncbi:MAG: flagellar biosynthesis anti-sigma factor FlgM [Deltaproteobacteria bacterium]|nr:flagellar biosynthesis anti-sigma factor FlgM [Deltaproteobacteria bacterium]MBW1737242.1 flagellar biosynthesis anti-sigma factor FlgM [Deltaproteobacteria bacterium]MBW1908144.1 flagellar biosynthesis anti-sigma factor FlgM [Deltaproteobacteria bacterium]MBW2032223.1 flagellar biosynthesis anti-sigma factor FlgM [Deltaproteobacteria bacterium]MBW2113797.1 flagellar biosynthesis anti-sigma factor FlgM [Deltaproteobacteria bacterium]